MKKTSFAFKFGVLLYVLVVVALAAFAQQPVIASHPRIFLNASTKATLMAKKNNNDPDWQAVLAAANKYTLGTVIPWNETSASDAQYYGTNNVFYSYCGSSWEEAAMTLGMAHQLTKGNNTGPFATAYSNKMLEFADVIIQAYHDYPPNASGGPNIFQFNTSYATRHVGKTIAVIYDYCYDELGATRKAALLSVMKDWFTYMSGAPYRVFQLQDQPTGNYFFGQVICAGYMGLAIGADDPLSQKMLDFARQRITGDPGSLNTNSQTSGESANNYFTQSIKGGLPTAASQDYLGPKQYVGAPQKDGMQNQGWSYGGETDCYLIDYFTAVKSATGEDMLQTNADLKTFFAKTSISIVHAFTPNRFQIDNGNDNGGFIGSVANYSLALRLSAILEGTPEGANFEYFRVNQLQPVNLLTGNTGTLILPWEKLLYNKVRAGTAFTYKPYYPVPTVNTYNAPAINTGMHRYIMRKDWGATSTWAALNMNIGVYDAHKQNKAGHFQIVRGDSHDGDDQLLIGANEVSKQGGNGIDGPTNYSFANSFDNTLFINDFNDYDIPYQDYPNLVGGQNNNGYDEPTHEEQNDNFSYFRSDLTSAYFMSYSNPDTSQRTLKYYYRSFLYLRNTDVFVVYDKLLAKNSANALGQYKKHLRWHFLTAPTVSGGNITEVMDNSKLYIHTVLPASTSAVVVNENTNPDNTFGSGYDYAFNTNTWRTEVSVTGNPLKQDIVTVLQPGAKNTLTEMVTTAMQTNQNNMEGSMIVANGNTEVVLFNNSVAKYPAPVTLTAYSFAGSSTANHTLCGMDPNKKYTISYAASVVTVTESVSGIQTASPSGVLSFQLSTSGLSNDASLTGLTASIGTLSPAFAAATTNYADTVGNSKTSITVTPVANEAHATIQVNGTTVASGAASASLPLAVGNNTITVTVTAQDGTTTQTYTLTIMRLSNDATLSALTLSSGTLNPVFAPTTITYTATVGNSVSSINVTPTKNNAYATISVNGTAVNSGTPSARALAVGANPVQIIVTAQNGAVKTYTVTVIRQSNDATLSALKLSSGSLNPAFAGTTVNYTSSVTNATSSITLTPTKNNTYATISVNGTAVNSGTASLAQPLAVGANAIKVVVTAQNGAVKTYTVTVTRLVSVMAMLSNLTISSGTLTPTFTPGTISYADTVNNSTAAVTVTPTQSNASAVTKVNGTIVASGAASQSLPLVVGLNTISVVVTASDGTITYTLKVMRKSNDATLSALTLSSGMLSPAFAPTTIHYTVSVSNATSSITLTPTKNNTYAMVSINGSTVNSGTASLPQPLLVGVNTIKIVVTAQNSAVKTYTLTIDRAPGDISGNPYLSDLVLSSGTLSPAFTSGIGSYTATVSHATTAITVTPTAVDRATIKVNGVPVASGTASASLHLVEGDNVITIFSTAQDSSLTKTYTVTVSRPTGSLNSLYLPGGGQTPLVTSLNEKVEANNILSPNGDGINDIWVVKNIAFYPNNTVTVYNKAGEVVFTQKGYANDWHGTYRGSALSEGTYYYLVDLGEGGQVKGFITVLGH